MNDAYSNLPQQHDGGMTDFIHFADLETQEGAHRLFMLAKNRLKDVSNWHQVSGPGSSKFSLTDAQGNVLYGMAQKGNLFYVDLPAPGSIAGSGLDWVYIEGIQEAGDANTESEFISIRVRPVVNPRKPSEAIANFYDHQATNTFIVERYLNHVSAAVHGRNEVINNADTNLYDGIRNTITALTARKGLSGPQWKALVEGLLKE